MKQCKDSLGGQNSKRRLSGARSSRALCTIFKKLRAADRRITELDKQINFLTCSGHFPSKRADKLKLLISAWDLKRRYIREIRKSYGEEAN